MLRRLSMVILGLLASTGLPSSGQTARQQRVMTVCEVLRDVSRFRTEREIVEVRGQWSGLLWGECPVLQTEGYTWPNALWVVLPSYPPLMVDREFPINWETTFDNSVYDAALKGAWAEWERLPASQKETMAVMATITGRLDVRPKGLSMRRGLPEGYGIQLAFPAQLVVVGIKDVAVVPVQRRIANPPGGPPPLHP